LEDLLVKKKTAAISGGKKRTKTFKDSNNCIQLRNGVRTNEKTQDSIMLKIFKSSNQLLTSELFGTNA
jgi:hypothetical protein